MDGARSDGHAHVDRKRIVAAGIEDDQLQLLGRLDRSDHPVERHRLVLHVAIGFEAGVDWNEVVGAIELEAVAGEIDDRPVGTGCLVGKVVQCLHEVGPGGIEDQPNVGKSVRLERLGDRGGIALRIGELGDRSVGGVTDH